MKRLLVLLIFVLLVFISTPVFPFTFYVNPGDRIQEAIDIAIDGDVIIVRDDTYTEDGNRDIDFHGKKITLKSENGPEVTIIDCEGTEEDPHRGFYFNSGEGPDSVIEGFMVSSGYTAYGDSGISCWNNSSPTITNCIVNGNMGKYGGAIYCRYDSSPIIDNCTVIGNLKDGISCSNNSSPVITNCTIQGNSSHGVNCSSGNPTITNCVITSNRNAGILCYNSNAVITNCTITDNRSSGIDCNYSNPVITNCVINGNLFGGVECEDDSNPTITNCTITGNLRNGGIMCRDESNPIVSNCIIWANNSYEVYSDDSSFPTISYCDIQGGWPGTANIDANPLLRPDGHLLPGSPCIDYCPTAPVEDIDGESRPFPVGGFADIGADEYIDSNNNMMPDWWELKYFGSETGTDAEGDEDSDGLINVAEYWYNTDPTNADTDFDGRSDGDEVSEGTNPWHPDNAEKTYYVNYSTGDDEYDGLASCWDGTHGPKATIQAGIDAAINGWDYTVLVSEGTYTGEGNCDIYFDGKAITLRSENGPEVTIIDCEGIEATECFGLWFIWGEGSTSVVDGFTVCNAFGWYSGGGICCSGSSPTIMNCIITNNSGRGGIKCGYGAFPTISNCIISSNSGYGVGCVYDSAATIINCMIANNGYRGVFCEAFYSDDIPLTVIDCTITGNSYGGICCDSNNPTITNCTISSNYGSGIAYGNCTNPSINDCFINDNCGSGISLWNNLNSEITGCTISDNS